MLAGGRTGRWAGKWVASTLVLIIACSEMAEGDPVCGDDSLCADIGGVETPANASVFRVPCQCVQNQTLCPSISFHVLYEKVNTLDVVIASSSGVIISGNCEIPESGFFAASMQQQQCGRYLLPVTPTDMDQSLGVARISVTPNRTSVHKDENYVCINASKLGGGFGAPRCIFFEVLTRPQAITISNGTVLNVDLRIDLSVGQELRLRVASAHQDSNTNLEIGLRTGGCPGPGHQASCPSPELPNQRWEGPTVCHATGNKPPFCRVSHCERTLIYAPSVSEVGQSYGVSFQAMYPVQPVIGQVTATIGVACGKQLGLCDQGPYYDVIRETNFQVNVIEDKPEFLVEDANQALYGLDGVLSNVLRSLAGTPEANVRQPKAYVNCPSRGFGIYARKRSATGLLSVELVASPPGLPDARMMGLQVTPPFAVLENSGGDNPGILANVVDLTKQAHCKCFELFVFTL